MIRFNRTDQDSTALDRQGITTERSGRTFAAVMQILKDCKHEFVADYTRNLACGTFFDRDLAFPATLSFEPNHNTTTLWVKVAALPRLTLDLAGQLLRIQSRSRVSRFAWDDEASRDLWIHAASFGAYKPPVFAKSIIGIFRDAQELVGDESLFATLAHAKAFSFAKPIQGSVV